MEERTEMHSTSTRLSWVSGGISFTIMGQFVKKKEEIILEVSHTQK